MTLLFDHNLSPRLVNLLADIYPNSNHLYLIGLDRANDDIVWQYALDNEYILVTKDSDFSELTIIKGYPPKVVWIRRGNCSTSEIEAILRLNSQDILTLSEDPSLGIISLF